MPERVLAAVYFSAPPMMHNVINVSSCASYKYLCRAQRSKLTGYKRIIKNRKRMNDCSRLSPSAKSQQNVVMKITAKSEKEHDESHNLLIVDQNLLDASRLP